MALDATLFGLPSPAASTASPGPTGSHISSSLPAARIHPLKPGSRKEIALINYVDDKILNITRRYGKKYSSNQGSRDEAPGYTDFIQVVEDIHATFEVVWVSGTPTIQLPYLLSLAGLFCSYMPAFPFSSSCFGLARRLDNAFTWLLKSQTIERPTLARAHEVSTTDKVRIKSLVEETRVTAVQTATNSGHATTVEDISSSDETDDEVSRSGDDPQSADDPISLGLAKMYKQTMEILGDSLT